MTAARDNDRFRVRRAEAAQWCAKLAEGLASPDEQATFEVWLADDPHNRAEFELMTALWHGSAAVADAPELIGVRADALETLRAANQQRWTRKPSWRWPTFAAMAASMLLVMAAAFYTVQQRPQVYSTAVGERRVVKLDDGSRLSLDANTRVEVAYSRERRALTLVTGRAKFDVAKDTSRPFTVGAADRMVVATGTAFSIELSRRDMRVVLYEGHVAVLDDNSADQAPRHIQLRARRIAADQALTPGNAMIVPLSRPVASVEPVDPVGSLSWEGGQLIFAEEPLSLAAERINRYSDVKIHVIGPASNLSVSGAFNAGDAEGFVDGIRAIYPLKIKRGGDIITISQVNVTS